MATAPNAVVSQGAPQGSALSGPLKLAYLGQAIQSLAKEFPQGQQGIQMMLQGLKMVQQSAAANAAPHPQAAPPR